MIKGVIYIDTLKSTVIELMTLAAISRLTATFVDNKYSDIISAISGMCAALYILKSLTRIFAIFE